MTDQQADLTECHQIILKVMASYDRPLTVGETVSASTKFRQDYDSTHYTDVFYDCVCKRLIVGNGLQVCKVTGQPGEGFKVL